MKKCAEKVRFAPADSGLARQVPCHLEQQYRAGTATYECPETGTATYECPEKVPRKLQRCGHEAKVTCAQDLALSQWAVDADAGEVICKVVGEVREGERYGRRTTRATSR